MALRFSAVRAHQFGPQFAAVTQGDGNFIGATDDVIIGDHIAFFRVHHHTGTQALGHAAALLLGNVEKVPKKRVIK